jgi:signal peptidase I
MRKFLASLLEVFEIALVAVGSVFLVRTFLVQPFVVSGSSMAPTFENGDYLLIDQLTYRFRAPERGEVVVFRYPSNPSAYFIKRIIGLPGERVKIGDNRIEVTPTGAAGPVALKESYLPAGVVTGGDAEYELSDQQYFVLGDNRSFSLDSRIWGLLEKDYVIGLARVRLWPLPQFTAFAAPQY